MITPPEYKELNKFKDSLTSWAQGRCVTVTRPMWETLGPIVKKYYGYTGSPMCRYCALELMRMSHHLWSEYREAHSRSKSSTNE